MTDLRSNSLASSAATADATSQASAGGSNAPAGGADPRAAYDRRLSELAVALAAGERRHLAMSNLRLLIFAIAGVTAWLAFVAGLAHPAWLLLPGVAFGALLVAHARILNANERTMRAQRHYERGIARIEGTWAGKGPDGTRFLGEHPYARDLDLFGPGSLFQLIDTAKTEAGEDTLADWLRAPARLDTVRARQDAVAELSDRPDFREALAVLAAEAHVSRTGSLITWATTDPVGLTSTHARLFAACACVTAALSAAWFADVVPGLWLTGWLAVSGAVALAHRRRVWQVLHRADAAASDLSLLEALLVRLEREHFTASRLSTLRVALDNHTRPSVLLGRLRRLIAVRDLLRNELARPVGLLLLVRSQAAVAIDEWHRQHRASLQAWVAAIGEFEALASLATYAYEHPRDPFPTLIDAGPRSEAVGLAHPLLPDTVGVRNDVSIGGASPRVLIVSGSNMSGKSTLLRAVGVNAVLALAGAPVRAERLTLSELVMGATIAFGDSLQHGHSRFYSEILKIRDIVALAKGSTPVLFLLDEILHGTNSHDRKIGAHAIVHALVEAGAIGLVTTHDLSLTQLAMEDSARARNVHFEDHIEDGRMRFDYRMREGVVEHSNALELMRAVGLSV